jgi:hypothetical protein
MIWLLGYGSELNDQEKCVVSISMLNVLFGVVTVSEYLLATSVYSKA